MTPKERVLATLNHQMPDKIPTDLGTTNCTSIARKAYSRLKKSLGVDKPDLLMMEDFQISKVDNEVLELLGTDTRGIHGKPHFFPKTVVNEKCYIDNFGITYRMPDNGLYYDMVEHPLEDKETLEEVMEYQWPDPSEPRTVEGIKAEAKKLFEENKYAIVGDMVNTGIFEPCHYVRGFEEFLMDLMVNKEIAHYMLRKMLDYQKARYDLFLSEVGEYLDIVFVGDDLASTESTLMSPVIYREMIKPYQKEYFSFIKSKTKAKLLYHSCGSVSPLIDDLIEIGVDILNPIQVNAKGMDTKELKKKFGDRVCFWGGVDTNYVLPKGTVQEVETEVRKRINDLGPEGYICTSVHDIQADVPAENIITMFKTAKSIEL